LIFNGYLLQEIGRMQTFLWENYLVKDYANQLCKLKIMYHARVTYNVPSLQDTNGDKQKEERA
jgi:hypothetical protein